MTSRDFVVGMPKSKGEGKARQTGRKAVREREIEVGTRKRRRGDYEESVYIGSTEATTSVRARWRKTRGTEEQKTLTDPRNQKIVSSCGVISYTPLPEISDPRVSVRLLVPLLLVVPHLVQHLLKVDFRSPLCLPL